jgi:hypothetical protein
MVYEINENIPSWTLKYLEGYEAYMWKNYPNQYAKVHHRNILLPERAGERIHIKQSVKHSKKDYAEIVKITNEFCKKYPDPKSFPSVW